MMMGEEVTDAGAVTDRNARRIVIAFYNVSLPHGSLRWWQNPEGGHFVFNDLWPGKLLSCLLPTTMVETNVGH
jgi:hypothetical protein